MLPALDEGIQSPLLLDTAKKQQEQDETAIRSIAEKLSYYRSLEERKQEVLRLIDEQGKLTES